MQKGPYRGCPTCGHNNAIYLSPLIMTMESKCQVVTTIVLWGLGLLFILLLLKLTLLLSGGILVLLVLRDQVIHVALSLCELHLIHTFTSVPVEEGLAAEHGGELLRDALEQLLDGSAVTNEGTRHLQATGWDVTNRGLDVVGDPFNEVAAVLVLHIEHLLINLLHGHAATEHGGNGEVAAVTWVAGSHHVLGVKHLLG